MNNKIQIRFSKNMFIYKSVSAYASDFATCYTKPFVCPFLIAHISDHQKLLMKQTYKIFLIKIYNIE